MSKSVKVKVQQSGFKSESYLMSMSTVFTSNTFTKIAKESINDFIKASPTPEIAAGWSYNVKDTGTKIVLSFENSTFENGENVAILIDVGHGTSSGNWVPGKNYLREPIKKTYKRINELFVEAR